MDMYIKRPHASDAVTLKDAPIKSSQVKSSQVKSSQVKSSPVQSSPVQSKSSQVQVRANRKPRHAKSTSESSSETTIVPQPKLV